MAYARLVPAPPATVAIERCVADPEPTPGDTTTVTVTVENTGEQLLPDIRIVDGVPQEMQVVAESPQHGTALRAGAATQFSYTVQIPAGEYEFEPAYVAVRDVAGLVERRTRETASVDDSIRGQPPDAPDLAVPLRPQPTHIAGPNSSPEIGEGIAFETVREYRRGDPVSHIDWNRYASSGELRTVQFQAERNATVVLVVDARPAASVRPSTTERTPVERSVEAATTVLNAISADGHRIGLAGLSAQPCWVPPGRGVAHRTRLRDRLTTDRAFRAGNATMPTSVAAWFRSRLPDNAQVVVFSPLCDDAIVDALLELAARGWPATVVSPTLGGGETAGQQLVTLERDARVRKLRARGINVVELPQGQQPALTLARAGWQG